MAVLAPEKTSTEAKPFLKWVGGKRQLLDDFREIFPEDFDTYYEPMIGGGAVFFNLNHEATVINDTNEDLIRTYRVVRDNVERLVEKLNDLATKHSEGFYYKTRDIFNKKKNDGRSSDIDLAAMLIYMNKTGFNGLYRVNQEGEFNVPIGSYKNPTICDENALRVASQSLANTQILCGDFEDAIKLAGENDFVYFDPPYDPVSKTANFTEYTNGGFGNNGQKRLAKIFKHLDKKGAKVALSNSETSFIKNLYSGFTLHTLKARRSINSNGNGRGEVNELLITNFS